ncbi:MAG: biopolymer transporter ExbD [Verrucomicrobia bacterium]|nr:biopolymer transporter ExbD [Verrucomicrobiota bacterium]
MNFRSARTAPDPGFQIAPMIDVIFLLLCFFVASQVFSQWETEIDIKLPTAETGDIPERLPGEVIINIRDDGSTFVNQQQLVGDDLQSLLHRIVAMYPGQPVLIRADKRTAYEHVIAVLDRCRKADIWNIAFATSALDSDVASP